MADRWMDERDRKWRDRDPRRSDDYGRGDQRRFEGGEDRSWAGPADDERGPYGARRGGQDRDRVFGERETGTGYGGEGGRPGGYGTGGYRGDRSGRPGGGRPDWQDRDYQGVSPAMQHGEYDLERRAERYQREHPVGYERGSYQGGGYQGGGRYYGDAGRERIYREEWSQGARDTGPAPRGYDSGRDTDHDRGHFDEDYESRMFTSGVTSGGTGGYDYERGYGDGGRRYPENRRRDERGQRWEQRGREAGRDTGEFFRKAGERVASWFGGDERRREDRDRGRDFRGMGPKGYKRNDERISDEVHERLTDDPYVDASDVLISVSAGEVTLSGTVENREAKHRAERCIEDVSGVSHVQNNLRIERGNPLTSPGPGFGDSVLDHQTRGETGAGDSMSGLGGSGSTGADTSRSSGGNGGATSPPRTSGSTSTDTGKSR